MKTSSKFRPSSAALRRPGADPVTAESPPEILLVEDGAEYAELLARWLTDHGFAITSVADGALALRRFRDHQPDLVLLDLILPGLDGWRLIDEIRAAGEVPIIVVTARGQEADRVRGLLSGADDYVTKPVSFPELVARIQGVLRRTRSGSRSAADRASVIECDDLRLDLATRALSVAGTPVHLTPTEFRLLRRLLDHPGEVLSHADLLRSVWGATYGPDDAPLLRTTVRNLRAKLARAAPGRRYIATLYGVGYRFLSGTPR